MKIQFFLVVWTSLLCCNATSAGEESPEASYLVRTLAEIKTLPVEQRRQRLYEMAVFYDRTIGYTSHALMENPRNKGALNPPLVMNGGRNGWSPANECEPLLARLFPDDLKRQTLAKCAIASWQLFLLYAPETALAVMKDQGRAAGATNQDIVRLVGAMSREPGQNLPERISKTLWSDFYNHTNPCYKILALDKYDSTEQSPAELLSLYRECLMDSFGYLQVRALEGIYRSKDFRPEVAALLKEYLNSNPAVDDGTLPAFPASIGNPVDGAKMILAKISKVGSAVNATPSKSLPPTASSTVIPPPSVQSTALKKAPEAKPTSTPSEEPTSSTPWSIIVVLIVAAIGLLWLVLKKRK
jgi:hypothetical protein